MEANQVNTSTAYNSSSEKRDLPNSNNNNNEAANDVRKFNSLC